MIRARHGVTFHRGLDIGDIDVVALLDPWTILVECKSASPSHISDQELSLFLQRARLLQPASAVLLIDSASVTLEGPVRRLNRLLLDDPVQKQLAPLPCLQGIWGTTALYVTGVDQNLDTSLTLVLQAIEQQRFPSA